MSRVVQAKCPHCQNFLRIPEEWLSRSMRCKFCKKSFQAKAPSSATASANATAVSATPAAKSSGPPLAKPVNAVQQGTAAPARPLAGDPFSFSAEESAEETPSVARRKKSRGKLLLVLVFFFLFALGATGAVIFAYKVVLPALSDSKHVAKIEDRNDSKFTPTKVVVPRPEPEDRKEKKVDRPKKDGPLAFEDMPKKDGPKKEKDPPKKDLVVAKKDPPKKNPFKSPPPFSNDPFPRRALLISVNNYLMYNNLHYGSGQDSFKGGYPGSSTGVLRDRLTRPPMNFPVSQVVELSDGVPPESKIAKPHSTQKSVLETTIQDFLDGSREQDRIVIFYAGHATDVEKKAYLVPIDGNVGEVDTLVPLKWVFEQMAKCKAQQKLLILDTFRYSPSRGAELPSTGEGDEGLMSEDFDKELQTPPMGVQVWSSCVKEQCSVELDGGSAFLQALCHSLQGGGDMTGISVPTQPLPIEALVVKVNQRLKDLVASEKKSDGKTLWTQISRLSGQPVEAAGKYDPKEPLPPPLALKPPTVGGGDAADLALVDTFLGDLRKLPPVRDARASDINRLKAQSLPAFSAKKLESYKGDGAQNSAELQKRFEKDPDAYAKEFPLRAAYFEALSKLEDSSKMKLREVLASPIDPKRKAAFLQEQEPMGQSIFHLDQMLNKMKETAEKRDEETSKRWQANFDYAYARLESRLIYLYEYNYWVGQIRADNLPELAPGQSGWRIGSAKKNSVPERKVKEYSKETKKLWQRIQDKYPGTPWALLAMRESKMALGLQWRPKSD